ncbi:MAG: hypothetical protein KAX13_03735 [Candidatus Krumholzibacteria bacterium]|nr:hypothetical protein [Candidatus Krumholzibacteria bacterium]
MSEERQPALLHPFLFALFPFVLIVFSVILMSVLRSRSLFENQTRILNAVAILLVIVSVVEIGIYKITTREAEWFEVDHSIFGTVDEKLTPPAELPNIHYIVLSRTILSLASSLNFAYMDGLAELVGKEQTNLRPVRHLIEKSRARDILSRYGYRFVALGSGFQNTELKGADAYLTPGQRGEFESAMQLDYYPED